MTDLGNAVLATGFVCRNPRKPRLHLRSIKAVPFYGWGYTQGRDTQHSVFAYAHPAVNPRTPPQTAGSHAHSQQQLHCLRSFYTNLFLYKVLKTPLGLYIRFSFFLHFKLLYNNWFSDFFFHFLFSLKSAMIKKKKRQKETKMPLARRQGGEKQKGQK